MLYPNRKLYKTSLHQIAVYNFSKKFLKDFWKIFRQVKYNSFSILDFRTKPFLKNFWVSKKKKKKESSSTYLSSNENAANWTERHSLFNMGPKWFNKVTKLFGRVPSMASTSEAKNLAGNSFWIRCSLGIISSTWPEKKKKIKYKSSLLLLKATYLYFKRKIVM